MRTRAGWLLAGIVAGMAPVAAAARLAPSRTVVLAAFAAGAVVGMIVGAMCMMGDQNEK